MILEPCAISAKNIAQPRRDVIASASRVRSFFTRILYLRTSKAAAATAAGTSIVEHAGSSHAYRIGKRQNKLYTLVKCQASLLSI